MLKQMAEKLQKARKSVGLSQNQVADSLGISRGKIINIEKGVVAVDVILLGKLAKLYGYSLDYFIDEASSEDTDIEFALRGIDLTEDDAHIPAWARGILLHVRDLQEICEEAGI